MEYLELFIDIRTIRLHARAGGGTDFVEAAPSCGPTHKRMRFPKRLRRNSDRRRCSWSWSPADSHIDTALVPIGRLYLGRRGDVVLPSPAGSGFENAVLQLFFSPRPASRSCNVSGGVSLPIPTIAPSRSMRPTLFADMLGSAKVPRIANGTPRRRGLPCFGYGLTSRKIVSSATLIFPVPTTMVSAVSKRSVSAVAMPRSILARPIRQLI